MHFESADQATAALLAEAKALDLMFSATTAIANPQRSKDPATLLNIVRALEQEADDLLYALGADSLSALHRTLAVLTHQVERALSEQTKYQDLR